jgi:hypothetical protein
MVIMNKKDNLAKLNLWDGAYTILKDQPSFTKNATNIILNNKPLICDLDPKFNGYQIHHTPTTIEVSGVTPAAIITAIFELKYQSETSTFINYKQEFLFKTRFFKKEISYENYEGKLSHGNFTTIGEFSDEYLESVMQEIVKRGFNAFLIYSGYHPFEFFLDYKGFESAASKSTQKVREKNFSGFQKLLAKAKKYGLKTFLHHYVSHFPQALSDHLKLGLSEKKGRLSAFDHPEIDRYNRYIYTRTLETLPELDGFFFNFESIGNAVPFMKRTVYKALHDAKKKPTLFFRLWGVSDIEGMTELLNAYDGPKGLMHKSHETNDVYYYPSSDDHVRVWKKALPHVEFSQSMGPCHNCATNLTSKVWTDPEYIEKLMKSMLSKGVDSVSFQSAKDVLSCEYDDNRFDGEEVINYSKVNYGHLEAFCDVAWQKKTTEQTWVNRYAEWNQVSPAVAKNIKIATVESGHIIMKQLWQFCYGSAQEGYLFPARNSYYQEPFFYPPMSFMNRIGEIPHNIAWRSWVVRTKKIKVLPDDTEAIIDFVNPANKKHPTNHPAKIASDIKKHGAIAQKALMQYQKSLGKKADSYFVKKISENIMFGERTWREIHIGIELYSCYFAKTKNAFFKHIQNAIKLLHDTVKTVDLKIADTFNNTTASGPFIPDKDALEIAKILPYIKTDFPFQALQHYMTSHVHYNEIRRMCRPYVSVRKVMAARNRDLLIKAKLEAEKALTYLCDDQKYLVFHQNVSAWLKYVNSEITDLVPPAMHCNLNDKLGADEGFHEMRHDQNYRWGEKCWEDFLSFFQYQNFFRDDKLDCRATYSKDGLIISMREHGTNFKEREEMWNKNKGGVNQTGFMQIFLDVGNSGNKVEHYTLYFKGEGGSQSSFEEKPNGFLDGTKSSILTDVTSNFTHNDTTWRIDVKIPWSKLGRKPKPGEIWRLNVFSNPSVKRNRRVIWCQGYEMRNDVARLGVISFTE